MKIGHEIEKRLSQWDCTEIGRQLVDRGGVTNISSETVRRILANHKLKPWRKHLWLSPKVPRDAEFAARVTEIVELYTRPLLAHEMVLCKRRSKTGAGGGGPDGGPKT